MLFDGAVAWFATSGPRDRMSANAGFSRSASFAVALCPLSKGVLGDLISDIECKLLIPLSGPRKPVFEDCRVGDVCRPDVAALSMLVNLSPLESPGVAEIEAFAPSKPFTAIGWIRPCDPGVLSVWRNVWLGRWIFDCFNTGDLASWERS